jgi:large subunit ribosomal protein L13
MSTRTFSPRPRDIERRWYVVDAQDVVLGRLASEVARILRGKHKPIYAPHMDTGDHVIVVNAAGVRLTGAKVEQKIYYRHSGYPGGIRAHRYTDLLADRPELVVEKAVRGMLPKNTLGRHMLSKLSVYAGPEHPHQAQKPAPLAVGQAPAWEGLPAPPPKPTPKGAQTTAVKPKAAKSATKSTKPTKSTPRSARAAAAGATSASARRGRAASGGATAADAPKRRARIGSRSRSGSEKES